MKKKSSGKRTSAPDVLISFANFVRLSGLRAISAIRYPRFANKRLRYDK
jgi:hypothetical protein